MKREDIVKLGSKFLVDVAKFSLDSAIARTIEKKVDVPREPFDNCIEVKTTEQSYKGYMRIQLHPYVLRILERPSGDLLNEVYEYLAHFKIPLMGYGPLENEKGEDLWYFLSNESFMWNPEKK